MGILVLGVIVFVASFIFAGLHSQTGEKVNLKPIAWATRMIGVLMIVGGLLWRGVVQVPAGYQGVLLRFGALQGSISPGIHLIIPGVNEVILLETRTQKEEATATAASRDLQVVTTTLALNYRLNAVKVPEIFGQVGPDYNSRIIDPAIQESVKVVTSRYTAEELIRNRQQVKTEVEADLTRRLAQYNIIVDPQGLSITNFDFSPEFNKAIEAKQVAQKEAEKQKFVLQQAELQKQTEIARAQGKAEASRLIAESLRANGGSLVIAREWVDKWDGKLPSVNAGGNGGGVILDLSNLMKESNSAPAR